MGHFEQVEEAWKLCELADSYMKERGGAAQRVEVMTAVFIPSGLVDVERTRAEGGEHLEHVFLRSPYGLRWRDDQNDWVPFRHGPVDLDNI